MKRKKSKFSWKNVFILSLFGILVILNIALAKVYYDSIGLCKMQAYNIQNSAKLISMIGEKK